MKLIFTDANTHEVVVSLEATQVIDEHSAYWVVDFDSPVYKTYDFMIDCALYGLNEGQVTSDSYDDDEGKPLANWALLDDFAECVKVEGGYVCQFFDKVGTPQEIITHDEFFKTYKEACEACETYILAGLFGEYVS
jgi:hypothetical protein